MYEIVKSISFCYGHRLLNYVGPCANLHGHNAKVDILLAGETLDERGMLMDFSDIKHVAKKWVDETLDHTLLLCKDDPVIPLLNQNHEKYYVMEKNPTAENIAELIFNYVEKQGFPVKSVTIWETDSCFARFSR